MTVLALLFSVSWAGSQWLSVPSAPVAGEVEKRAKRSADGASWFVGTCVNARQVRSAIWTTTGLGVYEIYVNGLRVGDDFLKPGCTSFDKTRHSFSYDVTAAMDVSPGATNVFSAQVTSGWWCDGIGFYKGRKPAFRGVLEVVHTDGTAERFVTDTVRWRCAVAGPVLHAGIYDGEEYDARRVSPFWGGAGFEVPEENKEFKGRIVPCEGAEIRLREDLAMRRGPFRIETGISTVVDFEQNAAAVMRFRFRAKAGTELVALPGEMLNDADAGTRGCDGPKGSVYRANLRMTNANARVRYVFSGEGTETYMSRFTYFGFRYVELQATGPVEIESIESVPVTSIGKEMETGVIETGNASVNQLISNVRWGQLSNYLSIPTDCPQRDERQGWTADTQVFAEAGSFNADTRLFLRKWMRDLRDTIGPECSPRCVAPFPARVYFRAGWTDALTIVPYVVWRHFGDLEIVRENFEAMRAYVDRLAETRYRFDQLGDLCRGGQFGDWLSFEKYEVWGADEAWKAKGGRMPRPASDEEIAYWNFIGACYWLMQAQMLEELANAIGKDARRFHAMRRTAVEYIRKTFLSPDDGCVLPHLRDMQTPALFALRSGVLDESARLKTIDGLRKNFAARGNRLQTGFLGTSILMDTLTDHGMVDVAYELLFQRKCPSWLYSVDQGATTIWERWDGYSMEKGFGPVGMNSFNHYAYGAVLAWIYKTVAGIASDSSAPGFHNVIMRPVPDRRLGYVKANYRSPAGLIRSSWRYDGPRWIWEFSIPDGVTATVTLPGECVSKRYKAGEHHVELVENAKGKQGGNNENK